jgi:hypothetical protein
VNLGMRGVTSLQAGGFKLTMAMAPQDQQGQPKKLLKFVINKIQTLLNGICGCGTCVRSDTPPRPRPTQLLIGPAACISHLPFAAVSWSVVSLFIA